MALNLFELFGTIAIDASLAKGTIEDTMLQVGQLKEQLEGTQGQANKTGDAVGKTGKLGSGMIWLGNTFSTVTNTAGRWIANGLKNAAKLGIGFNANIETYERQFEVLLQNEEAAKGLVDQIKTLAKVTPLGMEGLTKNAVSLLTTGTALEDVIPTLEMLGNLALGDQEAMNGITRAYYQILSKGQLYSQEINQLADQGVPIIEIMTKYGGEAYEDGSWYQKKLTDQNYKIPAQDMMKAFAAATGPGGDWEGYMFKMMDTYSGQMDRLGESGKETLGNLTEPFFNLLSSDILPRLADTLEKFNTWVSENKESITELSKALGDLAVEGFDKALNFFSWAVENQEAVTAAFGAITLAVGGLVATTHPWLTAISAILAGLVEVASLQQEINEYETKYNIAEPSIGNAIEASKNASKTPFEIIRTLNETEATVEVGAELQEGTENNLQTELDGQNLSVDVKVNPIWSAFLNFNKKLGIIGGEEPAHGSHADGLDYVPFDNYRAILHRGEAVLTANEARDWRGGQSNGELASTVAAAVRDAVAGIQFNVSLDGGALIGQLAPTIDRHLGTLANRKGRG